MKYKKNDIDYNEYNLSHQSFPSLDDKKNSIKINKYKLTNTHIFIQIKTINNFTSMRNA